MSFEPIYEVATTDSPEKLCSGQAVVEAKLFAPPGITISKILSVAATAYITASEVFAGEVRYNGKVVYRVLLLGSEGETECLDYSADFSDKLLDERIERGMRPVFDYRVLDTDISEVGGGEIKLATVVETDLFKPTQARIKYLKFGGDGIFTLSHNLRLEKEYGFGEEKINVSDSAAIGAQKLLGSCCRAVITKKSCAEGFISVEGKFIGDFCLEADGNITSTTIVTPFATEISAEGCNADCKAFARITIESASVGIEPDEAGAILKVDYVADITGIAYGSNEIEAVCDAFCTKCELGSATESIRVRALTESFCAEDCVTGTVTLDAANPIADSVMAVCSPVVHITSAYIKDGAPVAEGVVSAVILYYSAELNSKNSVEIELPFSLKLSKSVGDSDEADIRAVVSAMNVKIRRGGEFDVRADLIFDVDIYENNVDSVISELNEGEAQEESTSALTVHYAAGGEELFDVAKALKTAPETVSEQNPALEFPLKRGQRVILYRHLERE